MTNKSPRILMVDNFDSFVFNLVQYFRELEIDVDVVRNNRVDRSNIDSGDYDAIVISPGPGNPSEAGETKQIITDYAPKLPILGVCLGHQAIGEVYGASVIRAPKPMHGKTSQITHNGEGLFKGVPNPMIATRYHSLIVDEATIPSELEITARSEDELVMGMKHREYDLYGVQFHPESIYTTDGKALVRNFIEITKANLALSRRR
ncbi:MAG: aminodeoxychorismate/anthranilate synthase component II [Actinomycetota bacterium]|nr:aminodeoxychorismate/anthranilate synthase component II [Actinomycetota bacterium]